jgi:hypothetical protein
MVAAVGSTLRMESSSRLNTGKEEAAVGSTLRMERPHGLSRFDTKDGEGCNRLYNEEETTIGSALSRGRLQ